MDENDVAILKSDLGDLKVRMASVEGRIDGLVMSRSSPFRAAP